MDKQTKDYRIIQLEKINKVYSAYNTMIKIVDENGSTNYLDITLTEFEKIKAILTKG